MSTHNIGFYEEMSKIIFQLSANTHFICSSELTVDLPIRKDKNHFILVYFSNKGRDQTENQRSYQCLYW